MQKVIFYAALLVLTACTSPKGEKAEAGDKQEVTAGGGDPYTIDSTSMIHWAASRPGKTHNGTFLLKEGAFLVKDNRLTGGTFVIDVASIKDLDLSAQDGKEKLENHLKSSDFFDVVKHPTATFEITKVADYTDSIAKDATHSISGNLTLKDITKNITFPARITVDARSLSAKADFNIDRTMWEMNYKGQGNPQDWVISKQVNLKLDLSALKK